MRSGKRGSEPEYVTEEQDHDMDDTDYMFEPQDQMLYEAGADILQRLACLTNNIFSKKEKKIMSPKHSVNMQDGKFYSDKQDRYAEKYSLASTVPFDLVSIGRIVAEKNVGVCR